MSQVIIYKNPQGTNVCVCTPTGEISIQEVLVKDCPAGAIIVDLHTLPLSDEDFFNAWELNSSTVTVNLTKAKEITKNRLRAERAPLLVAQDVAFQRALEEGKDTTAIVAEKVRLRNITNLADACVSTTELRALKVK